MIKKFFILIYVIFLWGCGYQPLYQNLSNTDYNILIKEINGDRDINNLLVSKLKSYNSNNTNKNYEITINSIYNKEIVAKDTTGAASEYKIIVSVNFKIIGNKLNKDLNFTEDFNMKSLSDKLEENDYEKNIKSTLINSITRKLILELSKNND
tara:strand:- start:291 stop:749 length:459 start_codon:yes stop_codon:yes gene_type:complete